MLIISSGAEPHRSEPAIREMVYFPYCAMIRTTMPEGFTIANLFLSMLVTTALAVIRLVRPIA